MISCICYSAYGVSLRTLRAEDLEYLRAQRNNPLMRRWMTTDHEITADEMLSWYRNLGEDAYYLLVYDNDVCVGHVNAKPIGPGAYEPGFMFWGEEFQRRGGVVRAVLALYDFLFYQVCANRLIGLTAADNRRAIRLAKGMGFRNVGEKAINGRIYIQLEQTAVEYARVHERYSGVLT